MKILYIASVGGFFPFFKSLIKKLIDKGITVDFAANFSQWPLPDYYSEWGCKSYNLPIERSPLNKGNIHVIKSIKQLIESGNYDIVHCHTPVAAACTRLACKGYRKKGLKIIYSAHGFHFYSGAPLKNWIIFYPIEKWLSRYTDVLITITKEDYVRASKKFHAKKTIYIPGVGVDTEKFSPRPSEREKIRTEFGIKENCIMLLSVGELNENKNHTSVIKAIKDISNLTYVIVGKGEKKEELNTLAKEYNVDVCFAGYRTDVAAFYNAADLYILPSKREGLNVSLMEAMASGLAAICGRIRGNTDLIDDSDCLFDPTNIYEIKRSIMVALSKRKDLGKKNLEKISAFDQNAVNTLTLEIYKDMSGC